MTNTDERLLRAAQRAFTWFDNWTQGNALNGPQDDILIARELRACIDAHLERANLRGARQPAKQQDAKGEAMINNTAAAWRCVHACSDYLRKVDDSPRTSIDLIKAVELLLSEAKKH